MPPTDIRLNPSGLAKAQEIFLDRIPDFGEFTDFGSSYHKEERAYKDEARALFLATVNPRLFTPYPDSLPAVMKAVRTVLTARLHTTGEPQNIVGWRYRLFLREMNQAEQVLFATAFGELLYGGGESPERVERFVREMWPVFKRTAGGGNPYALTRIFPTFFLMLQDPARDIAVRTDLFVNTARLLMDDTVLAYTPFDAESYRRVLAFSHAVQRALMSWGWCPRDLIDVHSFLWIVSRSDEEFRAPTASTPLEQGEV
jgi:hypothetical protein